LDRVVIPVRVRQVLEDFRRRLEARFGGSLLALRLFGSFARGEASEDSDVDVFVLLREASWREIREVLDLAGDLWAETGLLVSPTVMDETRHRVWRRQERPLVLDIEREGVAL
jgi:predicted nucleotidyltransferase